ncbi:MAG TPA: DUF6236 family protein [Jatrophihabitans sp.]|nr:DUF6236 family protein [Jatrophihabitans sp.]
MASTPNVKVGLYYPFIQFRDDNWLKLAALYWDKVARIVPPGYRPQDSATVQQLCNDLDFVQPLAPSLAAMDAVSQDFIELVAEHAALLNSLYGIPNGLLLDGGANDKVFGRESPFQQWPAGQQWPAPWLNAPFIPSVTQQWRATIDPSLADGADSRLAYIFSEGKMAPQLAGVLLENGLATPVTNHGLIGLHPQLAFVYMHALAAEMASNAIQPLTDDDFDHVAIGCRASSVAEALIGLNPSRAAVPRAEPQENLTLQFAMIAIRSVIPKDLGSVPVEKIIKIRQRHNDELAAFQQATRVLIEGIPEALESCDEAVCSMYLHELYRKTLRAELSNLEKCLRQAGVDTVFSAMNVKLETPALLASGAALFGIGALHLNPIMVGAGAATLCLVPQFRDQRHKAQRIRADSNASFLLRLQEDLNPETLASTLGFQARRFRAR